ncbi:PAS domain-containing sensor histidine kinase [Paenibacillus alginolyticus]|uniref:histidine kinase n=1 Tax=Paenibacillus alginolyticus TaxID=59839 RepID=A0ABT4G724_9BACL|nr:PAS domain S-box protein [Paenibacillus alginolyticus]MCY9691979.1 PAS domain S-box protein [Paenibacillus alginolyticus]MEC0144169.1 PAS domain S-box protein [Paenibacillus alginolyticus]
MVDFMGNQSETGKSIASELKLLTSQELYHQLFGCELIAMAIVSLDGRLLRVNTSFCRLLGYTEEELIGLPIQEISHLEDVAIYEELCKQTFLGERISSQKENRYVHKDGSIIWGMVQVSIVRDTDANPSLTWVQIQDVSERKRLEQKLEESKRSYQSLLNQNQNQLILNAVSEGLFGIDEHFGTTFWNKAAECLTGYTYEEMMGKNPYQVLTRAYGTGEDLQLKYEKVLYRTMLEGVCECTNELFYKKNGDSFPVEYMISPILDQDQIIGVVLSFIDITQRQGTEELLRKSDKMSLIGQLAAGVAHEIRNPLTTLKGFMQFLQQGAANKKEYYDIMMSELERIELITTEMLVLAKPQFIHYQPKSIENIIKSVITLLETQAIISNIQFVVAMENHLPLVLCEENQMKQAFINLLKNAMEAMPDGGQIDIQLCSIEDKAVRVLFQDRGHGIPHNALARLGEPFYTTKEKGTGLGIMITNKIIEDHHGQFVVESKVGEGTVVSVTLPITYSEQ